MKQVKNASVTVVIPCYNEAGSIGACLAALRAQTVLPLEIIVVDNNSRDNTADIAKTYAAVRIIKENKPGLIAARNAGFAAAKGDIIARIDADTRVADNWVETMVAAFTDDKTQAITGTGYFYDSPAKEFGLQFRHYLAVRFNRFMLGHEMLWGSNMAVRRSAWQVIAKYTCVQRDIMEDLDIAIHMADTYGPEAIRFVPELWADVSLRAATVGSLKVYRYMRQWPTTLRYHGFLRGLLAWPATGLLVCASPFVGAAMRLYDPENERMQISKLRWQAAKYERAENP